MGKTREFCKKIRDTQGIFHANTDTIKERKSKDITEAEEIKRWQEYTELHKKGNPDNHDSVVTHLEPDILEYEVKWALGRITMNKTG